MPTKNKRKPIKTEVLVAIITGVIGIIIAAINIVPALLNKGNQTPTLPPTAAFTDTPVPSLLFESPSGFLITNTEKVGRSVDKSPTLKNFIAKISFITPYTSDKSNNLVWDIGFSFRQNSNLVLSSLNKWYLQRDKSEVKGDTLPLRTNKGEINEIVLYAFNEAGCLYINGDFVADLDLLDSQHQSSPVSAISAYFKNDNMPDGDTIVEYKDFQVFELNALESCPNK